MHLNPFHAFVHFILNITELGLGLGFKIGKSKFTSTDGNLSVECHVLCQCQHVPVPARASCMIFRSARSAGAVVAAIGTGVILSSQLSYRNTLRSSSPVRQACSSTLLLSAMHGRCWDAKHFAWRWTRFVGRRRRNELPEVIG